MARARATKSMARDDVQAAGPERPRLALARPITLVDQIAESVVQAAAEGRFLPGDRLNEGEIAAELAVSRVPVREALRLLESQGIAVRSAGQRGLRLMPVDAEHLHQILIVRTSLEQLAARDAVAVYRRDPSVFAGLEAAVRGMERAAADGDAYAHATADTGFHRALCRIGGNEVLLQIWETLSRKLTIIIGLATFQKDLEAITREHHDLLRVLKSGSLAAIDAAIHEHIVEFTERVDFEFIIERRRAGAAR
jgi:DNA-binding GntR family transcriptional regulator